MSGKPQDWQGKPAADLRAAWGQPTKVIPKTDGSEVWEYIEGGDFKSGGQGGAAAGGGASTGNREQLGSYQKLFRFGIKNGKIKTWYAARIENGKVVWEDH